MSVVDSVVWVALFNDAERWAVEMQRQPLVRGEVRSVIDPPVTSCCIESDYAPLHRDRDFDACEH